MSEKVRQEIAKVLNESNRRDNARIAQEAINALLAYIEKRKKILRNVVLTNMPKEFEDWYKKLEDKTKRIDLSIKELVYLGWLEGMSFEGSLHSSNSNDYNNEFNMIKFLTDKIFYKNLEQNGQLVDVKEDTDLSTLSSKITHVRYPDGTIKKISFS